MLKKFPFLAIAAGLVLVGAPARPAHGAEPYRQVIVLGFDGADADLVREYMDQGALPNLKKLAEQGSYLPLRPTNPPQTPVSWSTFATGWNPGKTEILDFLKRQEHSYFPTFAMNEERAVPFLFGARNPLFFGLIVGAAVYIIGFGGFALFGWRRLGWLLIAPIVAVGAGWGGAGLAAGLLPEMRPGAVNHRKGVSVWKVSADRGIPTRVIRVPATFPAEQVHGMELLSGLGVPDMRGRVGTPSYYTSDPGVDPGDNEFSLEIIRLPAATGTMAAVIKGPANKPFFDYKVQSEADREPDRNRRREVREQARQRLREQGVAEKLDLGVEFSVDSERKACTIRVGGQEQTLQVGDWSDWFLFDFPVNWLVDRLAPLRGIGRFRLMELEPDLTIYLSPINFHPASQPVPFSFPVDFAPALSERFGLFKTIGWAIDTWTPTQRLADEDFFLEDMYFTVDQYEKMLHRLLDESDEGLFIQVFMFTDRIGHIFWQFLDPEHPLYDRERAERFGPEMLKAYQRMDAIVGRVMDRLDDETLLIVCSDHGFASFRRSVNYNTWLVRNGFMALRAESGGVKTLEDLFDRGQFFQNVDWSRTRAYAMGLGNIYVNLAGREPNGTVLPGEEYSQVREAIIDGLEGLVDPETGDRPVARVFRREDIYTGFDPTLVSDLRAANAEGYRVSWQTALGGVPRDVIQPNEKPWSGDHCSMHPDEVPAIFFSSAPVSKTDAGMEDLFPTILNAFQAPIPEDIDGESLF
jgi:predicted AlkP superfamily phosphohydrolase/phosphomutase